MLRSWRQLFVGGWGEVVTQGSPSWTNLRDEYSLYLLTQGRSEATIRSYLYNSAYFSRWCNRHRIPLRRVSTANIQRFLGDELEQHSRSTAMNRLLAVRAFYRFLVAQGICSRDPTAALPIKRNKLEPAAPYSQRELRRLRAAVERSADPKRNRALLLMLLGSGLRRAELLGVRTEDVDWQRGRVLVRRGKGGKQRWVSPGRTALEALREYVGGRHGQIWLSHRGKPLTGDELYKIVRQLGEEAGVVHVHPHRFRGTFAVQFLREYGNLLALKELLGHASLKMTEHYARWGMAENALGMQERLDLGRLEMDELAG